MAGCTHFFLNHAKVPGTVLVVYCVDTESNAFNYGQFSQSLNLNSFVPNNIIGQTFDSTWRDSLTDSYGSSLKITWFLMTIEGYRHTPQGINAIPEKFLKHFGERLSDYGDEIGWHYHHADWYWNKQKKQFGWNQIQTFSDSVYREKSDRQLAFTQLASFIYLNQIYPASFRAGWNWENTDFSNWQDSLIPFDYSNNWPEVDKNVIVYRPSHTSVFESGNLYRTIVRCVDKLDTTYIKSLFEKADKGENVILSHYTHNYGGTSKKNNTLKARARAMHNYLTRLSSRYSISFRYCSAREAADLLSGTICSNDFDIDVSFDPQNRTIRAEFDERVFGTPIVCYERKDGWIDAAFMKLNVPLKSWEYPVEDAGIAGFIVASVSKCGQSFLSDRMVPQK